MGILVVFKYYNFFADLLMRVCSTVGITLLLPTSSLLLPVGISFYTFQALGYSIDVYRKNVPHEKNFFTYALFVSFFPQLVAGPIERSNQLLPQFHENHTFSPKRTEEGLRLILLGLFKKVVVADLAALYVDQVFIDLSRFSGLTVAAAVFLFTIQIYCDFSGYSDVARGSAWIFGFRLMENFNAPYFSTSITEFWSRWHISLSTWFRDYLYIPLGGNRKSFARKCVNLLIVFVVSGLWHGASLTFVVWGLLHGCFRVWEELWRKCVKPLDFRYQWCFSLQRALKTVCCFLLVAFAWIFFRAESVMQGILAVKKLFAPGGLEFLIGESYGLICEFMPEVSMLRWSYVVLLAAGICLVLYLDWKRVYRQRQPVEFLMAHCSGIRWLRYYWMICSVMFAFIMTTNEWGQAGAFLYFQF